MAGTGSTSVDNELTNKTGKIYDYLPNPVNSSAKIEYTIDMPSNVSLTLQSIMVKKFPL